MFKDIKIKEIIKDTDDAVHVVFDTAGRDDFAFTPGQYLNLKFEIKGEEARRAYSICSAPWEKDVMITVKRLEGGLVSNYIQNSLKVGDVIQVSVPEGRFVLKTDPERSMTHYMFAAGSGITPIFSMVKAVLEQEPLSTVHLLYGNKNQNSIIFSKAIEDLAVKYEGQFNAVHILSRAKKKGLFNKNGWAGWHGRIEPETIVKFIDSFPPADKKAAYICGPGEMIKSVENTLANRSFDAKEIHREYFTIAKEDQAATKENLSAEAGSTILHVELNGEKFTTTMDKKELVLDHLIGLKKDPPHSCTSGACSSCMAFAKKGSVSMEVCYALDEDEVKEGYFLACQAHPTSEELEFTFDI